MSADPEQVEIKSRMDLRAWLADNHARADSIWLIVWKRHTAFHTPYDAIVEEALCYGWIDSQPRSLDADRSMVRLSPRRPGSGWSGVNKARLERLAAAGLLAEPGLAKIDAAKRDGSWTALDSASALEIPFDLVEAFSHYPHAAEQFDSFPPSTRRAILEWISAAKRSETRAARIEETATLAARGERANQWPRR